MSCGETEEALELDRLDPLSTGMPDTMVDRSSPVEPRAAQHQGKKPFKSLAATSRLSEGLARLEQHLSGFRRRLPGPRRLLAALHNGDLLVYLYSNSLLLLVWSFATLETVGWLVRWPLLFEQFERWLLIVGFIGQIYLVCALYLVVRTTMVSASIIKAIPRSRFRTLRLVAAALRWSGEFLFLSSWAYLGHLALTLPLSLSLSAREITESPLVPFSQLPREVVDLNMAAALALGSLIGLIVFYGLASAIDGLIHIEHNTREKLQHSSVKAWETLGTDGRPL